LDFELLRVYGLRNTQEGILHRSPAAARYVVSYAFLERPRVDGVTRELVFGRLRVSIVGR